MNDANTELVIAHTSSGAEELARKIPKAQVVSAFGTVPSEVLYGVFEGSPAERQPAESRVLRRQRDSQRCRQQLNP